MSDRHFFNGKSTLVDQFLLGFAATRPDLHLKRSARVLHRSERDVSKVALISGGGAGHEPGAVGMVGKGGLDAAVIGDVFASPRAEQVLAAIEAVPSEAGTILVVPNYTGDNLHFSLGRFMAKTQGTKNVEMVVIGDDISLPRSQGALVGRRGLAGMIIACKILGAASEEGLGFDLVLRLGRAISGAMASVCAALDHCHIPGRGRADGQHIDVGQVEIGLGLHNEKGVTTISQPEPGLLIRRLLDLLLARPDAEHDSLKHAPGDVLVLLANNQGGVSMLEMGALVNEALSGLAQRGIQPARSFCGSFMGSMNMPGLSLTLLNVSTLAAACASNFLTVDRILGMIDAQHGCASWPAPAHVPSEEGRGAVVSRPPSPKTWWGTKRLFPTFGDFTMQVNPISTRAAIRAACIGLIGIENELTDWDTYVGDGDCGDTCSMGAKAILAALEDGLGTDGNLIDILRRLTEIIQGTCGGTLGAISAVFLGGMTAALCEASLSGDHTLSTSASSSFLGLIAVEGLVCVKERTTARVGHRTIMDALIPFCATLSATGGLAQAIDAARRGAESTRTMRPRLGRAAYVGQKAVETRTPDPGAMAFVAVVQGLEAGLAASS